MVPTGAEVTVLVVSMLYRPPLLSGPAPAVTVIATNPAANAITAAVVMRLLRCLG